MDVTVLSTKGQVIIPAGIRRALGLEARTRLRVEERGGEIVLTPVRDGNWRSLRGALAGGSPTGWLEDERRAESESDG
jgi:AbrB family looped-hinge helix DNA binding protein